MNNMYYFEVPYSCTCESCGKKFKGIIKRGPLQIGGSVLTTGMNVAMNSAEMKLSKRLIENDLEDGTTTSFFVDNDAKCPYCKLRQSWYPMMKPKKGSYIGLYIFSIIGFGLLGMLIWGIFFFDDVIPFAILMALSVFLGIFLPYRSQKKNKNEEQKLYDKLMKEYNEYLNNMKKIKKQNKPEIEWKEAKHVPLK